MSRRPAGACGTGEAWSSRLARLSLVIAVGWLQLSIVWVGASGGEAPCSWRWSVPGANLKDHTFFQHNGWWYFAAIHSAVGEQDPWGEYSFAYARTQDFCVWEPLGTILGPGEAGSADERYLWAPHIIYEAGTYFLFYTGVNRNMAQTIMLATTMDPADPTSWQKEGALFRPDHPGMIYPGPEQWSDARDPMVLPYQGRYYLYYTGLDESGGIIGVAMAEQITGPYLDLGAVLRDLPDARLESPFVVTEGGSFYLYYNRAGMVAERGEHWRWAPSPFGPWQSANREMIGWAHDFARSDTGWFASYVAGHGSHIEVTPLQWRQDFFPAHPQVGSRLYLPLLR